VSRALLERTAGDRLQIPRPPARLIIAVTSATRRLYWVVRLMVAIRRTVWETKGRPPYTARIDSLPEERETMTKIDSSRTSRGGRLTLQPADSVRRSG
jgi:hypothetical protein